MSLILFLHTLFHPTPNTLMINTIAIIMYYAVLIILVTKFTTLCLNCKIFYYRIMNYFTLVIEPILLVPIKKDNLALCTKLPSCLSIIYYYSSNAYNAVDK